MNTLKYFQALLVLAMLSFQVTAQNTKLTKEQVLAMNTESLVDMPLDQLMAAFDAVGVSSLEELYALLLNKDVSSASKRAESVFDSPLSTTVLSYNEIIESGATSIPEALRLVPGVIVREKTNGNYDVQIRGNDNLPAKNMVLYSENNNTLVMINNRPVFNYAHGGTLWETLPVSIEDVDRIEVVRGPSSALYGPNAVTGVINIITKTITKDSPLLSANVQGGSLSTYIGDMAVRKQVNDKLSIGITGNFEQRKRNQDKIRIYNMDDAHMDTPEGKVLVGNGYYTPDEIAKLSKPSAFDKDKNYYLFPAEGTNDLAIYDIYDVFPNPDQAMDKMGVNGYLSYLLGTSKTINVSGGYQSSDNISSTYGEMPTPYSGRVSTSGYVDVKADINKLSLQANYYGGTTDFMTGNEGFKLDIAQYNFIGEYAFMYKNLGIRPGISYQHIAYDDSKYLSQPGRGFLNQEQIISIGSANLRLDYTLFEKLRLVAALRAEQYNHPNDLYGSYQFVASYKFNENNILRMVYSRANQSAFIVNTYSDYTWNIVNRDIPRVVHYGSNDNYDLKTMDMIEIGYRTRPVKSVLLDVEGFYQVTNNLGALMPNYTSIAVYNPVEMLGGAKEIIQPDSVNIMYQNFDLKSTQFGGTVSIDWVVSKKLMVKANATYQLTKLDNYLDYSRDEVITYQAKDAGSDEAELEQAVTQGLTTVGGQLLTGTAPASITNVKVAESTALPTDYQNNVTHKATPSYWGSVGIDYRPCKKIQFFTNGYFYGEQTFVNQYGTIPVESKFMMNMKATYHATPKLSVFVNARNLFDSKQVEFAYMDEIGALYLVGLHFKL